MDSDALYRSGERDPEWADTLRVADYLKALGLYEQAAYVVVSYGLKRGVPGCDFLTDSYRNNLAGIHEGNSQQPNLGSEERK